MRRRRPPAELLPPALRTFEPRHWLATGEDPTDPIKVHVRALSRYKEAVRTATGVVVAEGLADHIIDRWCGPIATRTPGECPCSHCGTSEMADRHDARITS